jgi:hypothetical protein
VPAAAVIPAPRACTQVVAVKKLVVGSQAWVGGPPYGRVLPLPGLEPTRSVCS